MDIKSQFEYISIISPKLKSGEVVIDIFSLLDDLLENQGLDKLNLELCGTPESNRSRSDTILKQFRGNCTNGVSFINSDNSMHIGIANVKLPKTGDIGKITIGVNSNGIFLSKRMLEELIFKVCDYTDAYWGYFLKEKERLELMYILSRDMLDKEVSDKDSIVKTILKLKSKYSDFDKFPVINQFEYEYNMDCTTTPRQIGWVNYWSETLFEKTNFPNTISSFDKEICLSDDLCNSQGRVWSLPGNVFTIENNHDRGMLVRAYERFAILWKQTEHRKEE